MVQLEGLCQLKSPMTLGIEAVTFRHNKQQKTKYLDITHCLCSKFKFLNPIFLIVAVCNQKPAEEGQEGVTGASLAWCFDCGCV
jgi:hypothetical protein